LSANRALERDARRKGADGGSAFRLMAETTCPLVALDAMKPLPLETVSIGSEYRQ